jgi:uncharacterized 2Fe-2S/4Fe-4S cluster protein (DUF4445 family)
MADFRVEFFTGIGTPPVTVGVPGGTLLSDAARLAGIDVAQPCGGQGRCGRCALQVTQGSVRRRSTLRLSPQDVADGYALACQSLVESELVVTVPPQEKIERRLVTGRSLPAVNVPAGYDPLQSPSLRRVSLTLTAPSLDNQVDDLSRLQTAFRQQTGCEALRVSLPQLKQLGTVLRQGDWTVTAIYDLDDDRHPRLVALLPGALPEEAPLWTAAIDIGTTTVTVWLVDLASGQVKAQAAEYNGQIARGEDVISRIIYASRDEASLAEMQRRVLETIHGLLDQVCAQAGASPGQVFKAIMTGNSTMTHLFLGIPATSIRLAPFITAANHIPPLVAREVGLAIHPEASVDCLPGVASYVGSDITAGVLSSGLDELADTAIFIDVGTNGETVLGCRDWLVTCACSAGPAFEGAGVQDGMRATHGAIEEVWVNGQTFEPSYRTIENARPRGLCGSGLISLMAELFLTGVLDKAGHINLSLPTRRVRQGAHGPEYVVAWADETQDGRDIAISAVDIDNLLRAKAAIYAGFAVLAEQVGLSLEAVDQVLIGGSFGRYINVEKAVQIGLLPDMPWERFKFLGNTAVRGAYLALLDRQARARLDAIASRMTYIELSADNSFYEAFMAALFLPHTDLARFPSVRAKNEEEI